MDLTSLIVFILALALVGFLVYLITTYIPMDPIFKQLIVILIVIFVVLYVLAMITGHAALPSLGGSAMHVK